MFVLVGLFWVMVTCAPGLKGFSALWMSVLALAAKKVIFLDADFLFVQVPNSLLRFKHESLQK